MTKDKIIEIAKEANIYKEIGGLNFQLSVTTEKLTKFADLIESQPQPTPSPSVDERAEFEKCWQPIESCPKDGKDYLLYRKGEANTARWKGDTWGGNGWAYELGINIANGFTENMPTHWMPLPKPPARIT